MYGSQKLIEAPNWNDRSSSGKPGFAYTDGTGGDRNECAACGVVALKPEERLVFGFFAGLGQVARDLWVISAMLLIAALIPLQWFVRDAWRGKPLR